jgi:cell wall-associated NlpC family hydrolase
MRSTPRQKKIIELLAFAKQFVGVPYKYGARASDAPNYFDCSGFVQYVFAHANIAIPRSTIEQAEFAGKKVKDIEHIQPGDLIFVHGTSGHYNKKFPHGIGHVLLYLGGNKVISAASKRVQRYPTIIEEGAVIIEPLGKALAKRLPIVIIKRLT